MRSPSSPFHPSMLQLCVWYCKATINDNTNNLPVWVGARKKRKRRRRKKISLLLLVLRGERKIVPPEPETIQKWRRYPGGAQNNTTINPWGQWGHCDASERSTLHAWARRGGGGEGGGGGDILLLLLLRYYNHHNRSRLIYGRGAGGRRRGAGEGQIRGGGSGCMARRSLLLQHCSI